jgi:hypothetical protein
MFYNLIIYDRNPWIYVDMAEQVKTMLKHKGRECQIIILWKFEDLGDHDFRNGTNIYFGHDIYDLYIKPGSILTEFDPAGYTTFNKYTRDIIANTIMSCYSKGSTREFLKIFPQGQIVPFKYGYMDKYDTIDEYGERDIDVCFISNPIYTDRRIYILSELKRLGYNVYYNKQFLLPDRRTHFYKRSKIILSIYSSENNLEYSSGSRIYPAVSIKGNFMIAEKCTDQEQHELLSKICINVAYNDMIATIVYYLKYPQLREHMANIFYKNVKDTYADIGIPV